MKHITKYIVEYSELKDKYYLINKKDNKLLDTFYGSWAIKDYLFTKGYTPENIERLIHIDRRLIA